MVLSIILGSLRPTLQMLLCQSQSTGLMLSIFLGLLLPGDAKLFELCVFALLAGNPRPLCMMLLPCCLLCDCIA